MTDITNKAVAGDVIVSPYTGGCLIGTLRAHPTNGEEWQLIRTEANLRTAIRYARQSAERLGVNAWVCDGFDSCSRIQLGPPAALGTTED